MSRIIFVTDKGILCDPCENLCDLCGYYLPQSPQREGQSAQSTFKIIQININRTIFDRIFF